MTIRAKGHIVIGQHGTPFIRKEQTDYLKLSRLPLGDLSLVYTPEILWQNRG